MNLVITADTYNDMKAKAQIGRVGRRNHLQIWMKGVFDLGYDKHGSLRLAPRLGSRKLLPL